MVKRGRYLIGALAILTTLVLISLVGATEVEVSVASVQISATPSEGSAPLTVAFALQTTSTLTSYSWDFQNDGTVDDTTANPEYTYSEAGSYMIKFTGETSEEQILNAEKTILVTNPLETEEGLAETSGIENSETTTPAFTVSVLASKTTGTAPLTLQFTASASTTKEVEYSWDFNNDQISDSGFPEPTYTFNQSGEQKVTLTVTDEEGNIVTKTLSITVLGTVGSKLNYTSYFPTELQEGENEITFIVQNDGEEKVEDITAKIVGTSIKFISSSTIQSLSPQEEDSLTVKLNFLKSGNITATLKLNGKNIPITFTVQPKRVYSQEELTAKLNELKTKIEELDGQYYEKKSQDYLVSELFDSIKSAKGKIQDAQEQLLTNNLAGASVTLNILGSMVEDISSDLENSKKKEVTILQWLKENALAITAIVAAFGTLSGIIVKLTKQAKKIGEDVKSKVNIPTFKFKKDKEPGNNQETGHHHEGKPEHKAAHDSLKPLETTEKSAENEKPSEDKEEKL